MTESRNRGLGPKNETEHAYYSGMIIQKVRDFVKNDNLKELINWGSGPRKNIPDPMTIKVGGNTGTNGIFTAFNIEHPELLKLYRNFLPKHLSMPKLPVVSLVSVDYNTGNHVTRYNEGMVMIKGNTPSDKEVWFVLSMPVETWLMMEMGVDWGFPKRIYDINISKEKTIVLDKGKVHFSLEFTPSPWTNKKAVIIPEGGAWGINNMAVVHPTRSDIVLIFSYDPISIQERIEGNVKITVDRNQPWSGLIPEGIVSFGVFQRYIAVGNSIIKKIFSK
ncbi:MAG: hypothetical protein ACTSWY_00310 [Promethearchaeota archaeon]